MKQRMQRSRLDRDLMLFFLGAWSLAVLQCLVR